MLAATIDRLETEIGPTAEKVFRSVLPGWVVVWKASWFWHQAAYRQDSEPARQKRNAILDLKLQLMVKPVVAGIQNHGLEPESNINRLSAGIGLPFLVSNGR